jgi:hypothetical protein
MSISLRGFNSDRPYPPSATNAITGGFATCAAASSMRWLRKSSSISERARPPVSPERPLHSCISSQRFSVLMATRYAAERSEKLKRFSAFNRLAIFSSVLAKRRMELAGAEKRASGKLQAAGGLDLE